MRKYATYKEVVDLFVEVLLEGCELILLQDATLPPRLDETKTVAHQLNKGCRDAEQTYP